MLKSSITKRLMLAGVAVGLIATPVQAQQLDTALSVAKQSTAAAASAQQQIEAADDRASGAVLEYRAVLQTIENVKLVIARQDIFAESQKSEISSLQNQLGTVEQVKQGLSPMMLRMAAELEQSIRDDLPFNVNKRLARLDDVKALLSSPSASVTDQYRILLNIYKQEVTYGLSTESYEGAHPSKPGNVVNFIRFGRTSLVYVTKDESEIAIFNLDKGENGEWQILEGANAIQIRQAIRVAKEEAAPELVYAPVLIGSAE